MIRGDPEVFCQPRFECFFVVDFQQLLRFPFKLTLSKSRRCLAASGAERVKCLHDSKMIPKPPISTA